jgi:dehydrogenase/reductase SDR family protein 12
MIDIKASITVQRDIDAVFRYVSDLSNIEQWDPGVLSSRKTTPGPVRVGTQFALKCSFFGLPFPMKYQITDMAVPSRVVFKGHGQTLSATDTIVFRRVGNATRIEYGLELSISENRRFIETWIGLAVGKIGKNAIRGLEHAFDSTRRAPRMRFLDWAMDKTIVLGMARFSKYGYFWSKPSWNPMVESLTGRTVLITGATSGIGKVTAMGCARLGAKTIIVGRNPRKVESVCREIREETGNPRVIGKVADLSLQAEIRLLARDLNRHEPNIHVLINNAGALFEKRQETAEGIECCLAVNLVCPFLLTTLLMDKLKASAPGRIINVSSGGMYTQRLPVTDLGYEKKPYDGKKAYARAKRGLVVLTRVWSEKLRHSAVVVHAMHPGWTETPGIVQALPQFYQLTKPILRTSQQGADTLVWLAAAREAAQTTGGFWLDRRPHTTTVLPGTRESETERVQFIRNLEPIAGIKMSG